MPAAGSAKRLGRLAAGASKEVLEVVHPATGRRGPAIRHLLDAFVESGLRRALVLTRPEKSDVAATVAADRRLEVELVTTAPTPSVVHTLAVAARHLDASGLALGFPDILFQPRDAFRRLVETLMNGRAEIVLGLFPTSQCEKTDMVELDAGGRPRRLVIKQPDRGLVYTWSIAAWRPSFSARLCAMADTHSPGSGELQIGEVIQAAIDDCVVIDAVCFDRGSYLDIGTPEDLRRAQALSSCNYWT